MLSLCVVFVLVSGPCPSALQLPVSGMPRVIWVLRESNMMGL